MLCTTRLNIQRFYVLSSEFLSFVFKKQKLFPYMFHLPVSVTMIEYFAV